jgi:hypothetical protein
MAGAPSDKDLEPLSDRKVVDRYLRYALDFKEIATCTAGDGAPPPVHFTASILDFSAAAFSLRLEINEDNFADLNYEQRASLDQAARPLRLSFSVNDVLFFAHARIFARQEREISVTLDLPVFKLQRREAVRIKIMKEHAASLELNGKKFIPHDLSAGGVSVVMDKEEKDRYAKGWVFEPVVLRFAGREFRAKLEVAGSHPLRKDSDRLWKVGFRFRDLPPAAEDSITREAILYTQKIWARWL